MWLVACVVRPSWSCRLLMMCPLLSNSSTSPCFGNRLSAMGIRPSCNQHTQVISAYPLVIRECYLDNYTSQERKLIGQQISQGISDQRYTYPVPTRRAGAYVVRCSSEVVSKYINCTSIGTTKIVPVDEQWLYVLKYPSYTTLWLILGIYTLVFLLW